MKKTKTRKLTDKDTITVNLAFDLLEIAQIAMPDSYFWSDSRCRKARKVIKKLSKKLTGRKAKKIKELLYEDTDAT